MHRRNVLEIDALRLLVTVAGTGSFTGAADRLAYTQSAVSRRIASLERQAGGPLFDRLPPGVRLTPAGRALHRHAVDVLERLSRAEQELAGIHCRLGDRALRRTVHVALPTDPLPAALTLQELLQDQAGQVGDADAG